MALSSYHTAICFNNQGVTHFEQGNYEQARSMFRKSLEGIKVALAERSADASNNVSGASGPCVGFGWSKNGPLHADLNLPAPAAPNFIFCRALVIVPPSDDFLPQTDLPKESTAIIYNMALAYMLSGFLTNCSSLLEKGRKFLEIALAIRQRSGSEPAKLDGERLLDVAICNNLGWINQEFCDFETAQRCFHEVSARLGPLHDSGHIDKQDCEGFIANLVLDAHPNMAAAA
jgi:tetratricopeptide (TPR) repeat protein